MKLVKSLILMVICGASSYSLADNYVALIEAKIHEENQLMQLIDDHDIPGHVQEEVFLKIASCKGFRGVDAITPLKKNEISVSKSI